MKYIFTIQGICLLCFFSLGHFSLEARHLVGGDLTYNCLGKTANGLNEYSIRLNVYRDCRPNDIFPTNTPFDPVSAVYIYDAQTLSLQRSILMPLKDTLVLELTGSDTCVAPPTNLCYAYARYEGIITLPDNPGGYHIVWGRCCRNETILNIRDPGQYGMGITARIPNTSLCNNSPVFRENLPTYICRNSLFKFDHSAFDADGDSLVYRLTTPATVGSQADPYPVTPPPPFMPVPWAPPYNSIDMITGDPSLRVDPHTGQISLRPTTTGQYVFSLTVSEFRNGVPIGQITRDIQINVIECPINFPPQIEVEPGNNTVSDTMFFERDIESCFPISIRDVNGINVAEDHVLIKMSGPMLDPSMGVSVTLTQHSISSFSADICWRPSCDYVPDNNNFIVFEAMDENTCPGPNITLDTFYFQVIPVSLTPPELSCITRMDANRIQLNWTSLPQTEQAGFEAYYIYRDDGSGWKEFARITNPEQDSFIDFSAPEQPGLLYCYQMAIARHCPEFQLSEPGSVVCSETMEPWRFCQASIQNQQVVLSWTASSITGFSSYNIYRKGPDDASFKLAGSVPDQTITSWTDSALDQTSSRICYRIDLINACGIELPTQTHCVIPLDLAETDFHIRLDWEPYTGWDAEAYEVWKVPREGDPVLLATLDSFSSFFDDREIVNEEGMYCYQVKAKAPAGNCSEASFSWLSCYTFYPNIFVPNAFSPNGDGINDQFQIGGSFVGKFELSIFDRWGRLVFISHSDKDSWDGMYKGRMAAEGVYVYRLSIESFEGEKFERSGSITLIR